ncbi:MAG: cytochrome c peroxidase [Flavobacteriales bacterium]|jgi:cytochrome c peroxidase
MRDTKSLIIILGILVFAFSCRKGNIEEVLEDQYKIVPNLPSEPYNYADYQFPEGFISGLLNLVNSIPAYNLTTDDGATLGRVLFYDVSLSQNYAVSCSSCHNQQNGFSDPRPKSVGFLGGETKRNSMNLVNHQFNRRMFWDLRANNLEQQVLIPIEDPIEMGMDLNNLVERLQHVEHYPPLFEKAFGTTEITSDLISKALAQFVRSIVSYQTKFDIGLTSEFSNFTEQENIGRELFFSNATRCAHCHTTSNFYQPGGLINGLDEEYADGGQGDVNGNLDDHGRFKVPSLRNVALSAPYMHDGRFSSLEEVIEFYNSGVQAHPFLDDRLTPDLTPGGTPYELNLEQGQKDALLEFLHTLTDHPLINDIKFSSPFPE